VVRRYFQRRSNFRIFERARGRNTRNPAFRPNFHSHSPVCGYIPGFLEVPSTPFQTKSQIPLDSPGKMGLNLTYTLRILSVILELVTLGIGIYSFHYSSWYNGDILKQSVTGEGPLFPSTEAAPPGLYEGCELKIKDKTCPPIELEQFYIAMLVITFLLSVALLILGILVELTTNPFKLIDFLSHVLGAVLLLIAAICYAVSAYLIRDLFPEGETGDVAVEKFELQITWKYIAAVFGLGQGVLLGIIAFLVS